MRWFQPLLFPQPMPLFNEFYAALHFNNLLNYISISGDPLYEINRFKRKC
jgi:hypothetical protein